MRLDVLLLLFPNKNYAVKIIKQKFKSKFAYRKIVISKLDECVAAPNGSGRISSNKTGNVVQGNKLVKASAVLVIEKENIASQNRETASCRSFGKNAFPGARAASIRTHSEQSAESGRRRNDSIFKAELLMKSAESMAAAVLPTTSARRSLLRLVF